MPSYDPGPWHAAVRAERIALLPPGTSTTIAADIWLAMEQRDGLAAVLETLVGNFGVSFSALPPFAVIDRSPGTTELRIIVRGEIAVAVINADGTTQTITGAGTSTWNECAVANAAAISIVLPGPDADAATGNTDALPLLDGVAGVARLRWALIEGVDPGGQLGLTAQTPEFEATSDTVTSAAAAKEVEPDIAAKTAEPTAEIVQPHLPSGPEILELAATPEPVSEQESEPAAVETVIPRSHTQTLLPPIEEESSMPWASTGGAEVDQSESTPALIGASSPEPERHDELSGSSEASPEDETDDETDYDDLIFGETRIVTAEDAALRDEPEPEPPSRSGLISGVPPMPSAPRPGQSTASPVPAPPEEFNAPSGDHDGRTIAMSQLPAAQLAGDHDGKTISIAQLRAMQESGELPGNPSATQKAEPVLVPTLVVSTGERFVLDRNAVVGRRPRAVRTIGSLPLLVAVPSPSQDISRSHIELRVEGGDILATDLNTTNGTRLLRSGKDPVRLHPGEPTLLVTGDQLDLGEGILLSFEGHR